MGDHLVLMVNRLLTESTLEAAIESRTSLLQAIPSLSNEKAVDCSVHKVDFINDSSPRKLVECRICQDEDLDSNMETPCSCSGSLKYAHRRCVQRWCNEKGNTTCEICQQQFKPGYTAPPPLFHIGRIPMNFRGNWEISRRDVDSARFMAMVSTEDDFSDSDYDETSASNTRGVICCRLVAIIFMGLFILRHTLPLLIRGRVEYTFPLFMLLLIRTAGIVLPVYVLVKAFSAINRRRIRQEPPTSSHSSSDEESEQPQPHVIRIQ